MLCKSGSSGLAGLMQTQSPFEKPDREIAEAPRISSADFFNRKHHGDNQNSTHLPRTTVCAPHCRMPDPAAGLCRLRHARRGANSHPPGSLSGYADKPLGNGILSDETKVVLDRFDLQRKFKSSPAAAIATASRKGPASMAAATYCTPLPKSAYLHGDRSSAKLFPQHQEGWPRIIFSSRRCMPISIFLATCASRRRRHSTSASARPAICIISLCGAPCQPAMAAGWFFRKARAGFPWAALSSRCKRSQFPWNLRILTNLLRLI